MRKYKRALFFSIFVICAMGFVVYRSKYLALKYTFEFGNVFDSSVATRNYLIINGSDSTRVGDVDLYSRPLTNWIQVKDFYVYSAFFLPKELQGISLAVSTKKLDCPYFQCHVWFSLNGHRISVTGEFSCNRYGVNNSTGFLYDFVCHIDPTGAMGAANMLVIIDQKKKFYIPIHYRQNTQKQNKSAVCVYPDTNAIESISVVEFLSYHQLIGFSDIIVYDSGMQHRILYLVEKTLQNLHLLRSFSVLKWNFPIDDLVLSEEAVRKDCLYRTSGSVELLMYLAWNEYLVPSINQGALVSLMANQSHKQMILNTYVKVCCIDEMDDLKSSDKSWPMIFRKTLCFSPSESESRKIILNPDFNAAYDIVDLSTSELNVYVYGICVSGHPSARDKTILMYLTNLMESKLLSIWRSGAMNDS